MSDSLGSEPALLAEAREKAGAHPGWRSNIPVIHDRIGKIVRAIRVLHNQILGLAVKPVNVAGRSDDTAYTLPLEIVIFFLSGAQMKQGSGAKAPIISWK